MAYLADLLDYAVRHLRENGNADQRSCGSATGSTSRSRTCPPTATRSTPRSARRGSPSRSCAPTSPTPPTPPWYLREVYDGLLQRLGTSTVELRDARMAADDVRSALAARLGVRALPGKLPTRPPDQLDILFDPIATGTLSETDIEHLFGFRDTHRDPLAADPVPECSAVRVADEPPARQVAGRGSGRSNPPPEMRPLIDPTSSIATRPRRHRFARLPAVRQAAHLGPDAHPGQARRTPAVRPRRDAPRSPRQRPQPERRRQRLHRAQGDADCGRLDRGEPRGAPARAGRVRPDRGDLRSSTRAGRRSSTRSGTSSARSSRWSRSAGSSRPGEPRSRPRRPGSAPSLPATSR